MTVIIDRNHYQSDRCTEVISPLGDMKPRFEAFGWEVLEIDGHDHVQIAEALAMPEGDTPRIIIADTVKGKGISFMEPPAHLATSNTDIYRWHSGAPDDESYERGRDELLAGISEMAAEAGLPVPESETIDIDRQQPRPETENVARAYGEHLVEMGAQRDDLVVMVADLSDDCRTRPFEETYPDRFIENGIAEQDMVSLAGGLASQGMLPVVNSFGCFLASRPNEQIYNNGTEGFRIIYAMHLIGLIPAAPGKSHQSLRDISLLGAIPNMEIMHPASEEETKQLLEYSVQESEVNCALRLAIGMSPRKIDLPADYKVARGRGCVLHEGKDAVLVAYGPTMLNEALGAAEKLAEKNVGIKVINMPWLNHIDYGWWRSETDGCGPVMVMENHSRFGGLGSAILMAQSDQGDADAPAIYIRGVDDYPACGTPSEVLAHHKLDAASVASRLEELIASGA